MIRILELFGGIGACSKALERLGIDYEIADYVEIDKYAVKSFNAIHNTNFDPQDICSWNKDIEVDLIMHGSPCQDFSSAGLQAGGDEGSGTRSSLMYETLRIVKKLKPKYVIWENVKNLLSKKHFHNFQNYLDIMEELGYKNFYQVLNAKDYGIPQNRERVFTISIFDGDYQFPSKQELHLKLTDYLDNEVGEKYYFTKDNIEWLKEHNKRHKEKGTGFIFKPKDPNIDLANTIRANGSWCPTDNAVFVFPPKQELKLRLKDMLESNVEGKYYLSDRMIKYISATGTANFKNQDCKINLEIARPLTTDPNKRAGTTNYLGDGLPDNYDLRETCLIKNQGREITKLTDIGNTLMARDYKGLGNQEMNAVIEKVEPLKIRRLTPKEYWRLMGFDDSDFEKAKQVNSDTQLYKQAGNSIVVNVLEAILRNLLLDEKTPGTQVQTTIFDFIGEE